MGDPGETGAVRWRWPPLPVLGSRGFKHATGVAAGIFQRRFDRRAGAARLRPGAAPPDRPAPARSGRSPDPARAAGDHPGQPFPVDPGLEHEHDARQRGAVLDRPAARMAVATRLGRRQQRSGPLPQPVRHEPLDHPHQAAQDWGEPPAATPESCRDDLLLLFEAGGRSWPLPAHHCQQRASQRRQAGC